MKRLLCLLAAGALACGAEVSRPPPEGPLYAACPATDCGGLTCASPQVPEVRTGDICTRACAAAGECPGGTCWRGRCVRTCDAADQCAPGERCAWLIQFGPGGTGLPTVKLCAPAP